MEDIKKTEEKLKTGASFKKADTDSYKPKNIVEETKESRTIQKASGKEKIKNVKKVKFKNGVVKSYLN